MALTGSPPSPSPLATSVPVTRSFSVPIRFQCPLCLDILRRPIQLPCCHRYLCMECFERALELTSVNCGFCRRRVVSFARTKQYKVDEVMWTAIKTQCPFLADEREPLIEFFDEDAPPLHHNEDLSESSGELKALYERQLRAHESQVKEAEQRAFEQTIDFLQNDPEFTASLEVMSSSQVSSTTSSSPIMTRSSRPITRQAASVLDAQQPKLDTYFMSSRSTSNHSGPSKHKLRRTDSTTVGLSTPRALSHDKTEPHRKYFLRSASHSPTPTKKRRRLAVKGRKPLLQLTLDTTISPVALHTRSRDFNRPSSKMLTRRSRRRSAWRCSLCTYTNTCFDGRCCMCRNLPPPDAYVVLRS